MKLVTRAIIVVSVLCMLGVFPGCPLAPEPGNKAPVAKFSYTTPTCVQYDITFDGSVSRDGDGRIASLEWDFGDNTTASGPVVVKRYKARGTYAVSLTVKDNEGAKSVARTRIEITIEPASNCASDPGCFVLSPYRWSAVSGFRWITMTMASSFKSLDPGWTSVDRNSGIAAMAEWHWNSCAKLGFYYSRVVAGITMGLNSVNSIDAESIDGPGGVLGFAATWVVSGRVVEVDVVLDRSERWGVGGESDRIDLVSVLTHELGHLWRLDDLPSPACYWETMYAHGSLGTTYARTLACGDKHGVQKIYGYECRKPGTASGNVSQGFSEPPQPVIFVTSQGGDSDPL